MAEIKVDRLVLVLGGRAARLEASLRSFIEPQGT